MNEIHRFKITITFDIWEPFSKEAQENIDEIILRLKDKSLMRNCGNVKSTLEEIVESH